jgi:hypothetical protein
MFKKQKGGVVSFEKKSFTRFRLFFLALQHLRMRGFQQQERKRHPNADHNYTFIVNKREPRGSPSYRRDRCKSDLARQWQRGGALER